MALRSHLAQLHCSAQLQASVLDGVLLCARAASAFAPRAQHLCGFQPFY